VSKAMLRYLIPYLAALGLTMAVSVVGYETGTFDAAGVYGLLYMGLVIVAIGVFRWERRHPHRH
jgi:uncharacterized membrane protein